MFLPDGTDFSLQPGIHKLHRNYHEKTVMRQRQMHANCLCNPEPQQKAQRSPTNLNSVHHQGSARSQCSVLGDKVNTLGRDLQRLWICFGGDWMLSRHAQGCANMVCKLGVQMVSQVHSEDPSHKRGLF